MTKETLQKIRTILDANGITYEHLQHDHVHTSQDAAKVRGTSIEQAAKALVLKEKKTGELIMFIVAGDRKLDLKTIKKDLLHVKNISLAAPQEVQQRTGCTIGSVPPFGNLFDMKTYFDEHLAKTQQHIVFSAGTHNDSIRLRTKDYLSAVEPTIAAYSQPSRPSPCA